MLDEGRSSAAADPRREYELTRGTLEAGAKVLLFLGPEDGDEKRQSSVSALLTLLTLWIGLKKTKQNKSQVWCITS